MSEAITPPETATVKKRSAAKKTAAAPAPAKKAAAKKRKATKRTPKVKNYLYGLLDGAGKSKGPPTGDYPSISAMLDDISLAAAAGDTVVIYREVRRGQLKTKVRLG